MLAGCGLPDAISRISSNEPKAAVTSVLLRRYLALARHDLPGFQQTIDLTRPAFRRCQQETFEIASRSGLSGEAAPTVLRVEPYGDGYLRAYVQSLPDGYERLYFRRDGERWILTEPKVDELGGERTKSVDGIEVRYWGVDEDVVEILGQEAAATREYLRPLAKGPIRDPYHVRIYPTRETAGIVACGFVAFANSRDEHAPFIGLWRVWYARSLDRVSDDQRATFRHEGLHYLQDQFIHGITGRLDWWLIEGWPDYVAQSRSRAEIRQAVCAPTVPTLKRLVDGVPTEPDTPPELVGQYYGLANSMMEYVYATYGKDSYWELIALYKDNVDYKKNYPKIFKADADAFYATWLASAKAKYCG